MQGRSHDQDGLPADRVWGFAAVKVTIAGVVSWQASRPMGPSRFAPIRRFHERHPRVVSLHHGLRFAGLTVATASGLAGAGFNLGSLIHTATVLG